MVLQMCFLSHLVQYNGNCSCIHNGLDQFIQTKKKNQKHLTQGQTSQVGPEGSLYVISLIPFICIFENDIGLFSSFLPVSYMFHIYFRILIFLGEIYSLSFSETKSLWSFKNAGNGGRGLQVIIEFPLSLKEICPKGHHD